jgi:hypothetical protein
MREAWEEEDFLPCFFSSPSFSLKPQKDADTTSPLACHVVEEWRGRTPWAVRGGCIVAALASLSPVFPINTGEESKKKKKRGGRAAEQKREGAEDRKKKEEKNRGRKEKKNAEKQRKEERKITAWSHCHFATGLPSHHKPPLLPPQAIANDSEQAPPLQVIFSSSSVPILVFIFICMQNVSNSRSAANEL